MSGVSLVMFSVALEDGATHNGWDSRRHDSDLVWIEMMITAQCSKEESDAGI
jgi:hypothetical protein